MKQQKTHFPCAVYATGLSHVQSWAGIIGVEADDKCRNSERTYSARLGVTLKHIGHEKLDIVRESLLSDGAW